MSTTDNAVVQIPLDRLHESPFNPRKHFDEAGLQELADDIKAQGRILQPLLVRPRIPELFANADDPNAIAGYELVFGHRRLRAAGLAELATAPCMVTSMTDLEVKRAQISENLQRRDVHPIEEAEGFQALITDHGETADNIAAQTGKSRTYVYSRLKLLALSPALRQACLTGAIGDQVALLVARLRHHKLQDKALARIKSKCLHMEDGGKESYRRIRALLNEHFTLDLKKSPFPIDDATIIPAAGNCISCPKRSAHAPEYMDVATDKKESPWSHQNLGPNVCTDPDCHQAKKVTFYRRKADELRADGHEVIDGNKARAAVGADGKVKGAYTSSSLVADKLKALRAGKTRTGGQLPRPVKLQDPRTGKIHEAYRTAELVEAGIVKEDKGSAGGHDSRGGSSNRNDAAEREARQRKAEAETQRRTALFHHLRGLARGRERSADEARVVALHLIDGVRNEDGSEGAHLAQLWNLPDRASWDATTRAWRDLVQGMTKDDLALLMIDCVAIRLAVDVGPWEVDDEPEALNALARLYGVDPTTALEPLPSAAQAQEGEADDADAPDCDATAGAGAEGAGAPAARATKVASEAAWPFPRRRDAAAPEVKKQTDEAGSAGDDQMDNDACGVGSAATGQEAGHVAA